MNLDTGIDPHAYMRQQMGERLSAELDKALTDELSHWLGSTDWDPKDLASRLKAVHNPRFDESNFYLDDRPVLTIGALQTEQRDGHIWASRPITTYRRPA